MPISLSHNSAHKKKNKIKNHQRRSQNRKIKRKQVLLLRNTNTNFSKKCTKYNNQETLTDFDTLADEILKLAKNTGFIKRDVGFDPIIFIESMSAVQKVTTPWPKTRILSICNSLTY